MHSIPVKVIFGQIIAHFGHRYLILNVSWDEKKTNCHFNTTFQINNTQVGCFKINPTTLLYGQWKAIKENTPEQGRNESYFHHFVITVTKLHLQNTQQQLQLYDNRIGMYVHVCYNECSGLWCNRPSYCYWFTRNSIIKLTRFHPYNTNRIWSYQCLQAAKM